MAHADIVNSWFREHLAGGPLGQSTEAYNQVHMALPVLIATLDGASAPTRQRRTKKLETAPDGAIPVVPIEPDPAVTTDS